jgi:hypothetical protein
MLNETNFCSLKQKYLKGECGIMLLLHPWKKRKEREIVKFINGKDDSFIKEYIERMT